MIRQPFVALTCIVIILVIVITIILAATNVIQTEENNKLLIYIFGAMIIVPCLVGLSVVFKGGRL